MTASQRHEQGHEPDRVDLPAYYIALAATAVVTLGTVAFVSLVVPRFLPALRQATDTPLARDADAPEPHLQVDPARELEAQRKEERARLSSYGWVDREHGVARVPIDVAMHMLLERR